MTARLDASVGIAGGGPVGLMLALMLDRYGVPCVLFDSETGPCLQPRGNTHNARTMEHYRRLGLADKIRGLGLPPEHRTDIAYFTRYRTHELARIPLGTEHDRRLAVASASRTDQFPEPTLRANQMYVERFLFDEVSTRTNVHCRFGWEVTDFAQSDDHVVISAVRGGRTAEWKVQYLVGCDGGHSLVRRKLGFNYQGESSVKSGVLGDQAIAAYVRLPTLFRDLPAERQAWSYWAFNPELACNLISLDGVDKFSLLTSSVDPLGNVSDALIDLIHRATGARVPVEVLGYRRWTAGSALVVERFADRRVLLAGDAAHLFTPTGGFGMNTGIDDVANLAWKLAARHAGWGGDQLIPSYELERRPVAIRNTTAARALNVGLAAIPRPADMEDPTAQGAMSRHAVGAALFRYGENTHAFGVQLGARYDSSPIVARSEPPPADSHQAYVPSAVPGGRAPHLWLDDVHGTQSSLYDKCGVGFTLLRLGAGPPDGASLLAAAHAAGVPMRPLDVPGSDARDLYGTDLTIIRPDQHIAWRGNSVPTDADELIGQLTGH